MPKKLNVSSNERIDLDDFNRASAEYTQESDNFHRAKLVQARRGLVSGGFRIEISDQASSPGEFTIYNGVALDRSGNILNNEQAVADARTLTLSGTGLQFYVEVEFVETESDVDSRAFWDPTFAGNTPPGKEFSLNVATRITPDWQVVQPVSTTSFDTNVNTNRVPVAVLYTNGFNEITGFTAVNASTVLEEDVGAAATTLRVFDSSLFPSTGTATVGGTSVTITANDRTNGLLTIAPAIGVAKQAGAVVVETGVTAAFLPEDTEAVPTAPGATSSKDQRRGLFKGDEIRGSALSANPEDAAARSDLQIRSLKDHVDFLSAQIRELKFGNLRSDTNAGLPPSSFTDTRYYDPAGSILGSRSYALTIGDETVSFGDLNSTSSDLATQIQAAHDALPSVGGTIFVKKGNYIWDIDIGFSKPTNLVFEEGVVIGAGSTGSLEAIDTSLVRVENLPRAADGWAPILRPGTTTTVNTVGMTLELFDSNFQEIDLEGAIVGSNVVNVRADRCVFENVGSDPRTVFCNVSSIIDEVIFNDCEFNYNGTTVSSNALINFVAERISFRNCTFDASKNTGSASGFILFDNSSSFVDLTDVEISGCKFISSSGNGEIEEPIRLSGSSLTDVKMRDCYFDFQFNAIPSFTEIIRLASLEDSHTVIVEACDFTPMGANTIPNTSSGSPGSYISLTHLSGEVNNIKILNNTFGEIIDGTNQIPGDFVDQIFIVSTGGSVLVKGNAFNTFTTGVRVSTGNAVIDSNTFAFVAPGTAFNENVYGVRVEAGASASVVNNRFSIDTDNEETVQAVGATSPDELLVSSNIINISNANTANLSVERGIDVTDTVTGALHRYSFIGNTMDIAGYTPNAIEFFAGNNVEAAVSISGNTIRTDSITASSSSSAIEVEMDPDSIASNTASSISGNTIIMTGDAAASINGITFNGKNISVSGNSIEQRDVEDTFGVVGNGRRVSVSSNTILQEHAGTGGQSSRGIQFISTGASSPIEHVSVSDNTIFGGAETRWGIMIQQLSTDVAGISIVGNLIYGVCVAASDNGGVLVDMNAAGSSSSGISVVGNTFIEQSLLGAGYASRLGIQVEGSAAPTRGVLVSGNNINGLAGAAIDRNVGDAGIKVESCEEVSVTGNVVTEWSDGTNDGTAYYIVNNTNVAFYSNYASDEAVGPAVVNFVLTSNTNLHVHGNMSIGGTIDTTASTNVTNTDNKLT